MEITQKEKVEKIKEYLKALPEGNYEILEHNLAAEEPTIYIQTSLRTIGVGYSDSGKLVTEYKMRRGKGSKAEFEKKFKNYEMGQITLAELLGEECQQLSLDQFLLNTEPDIEQNSEKEVKVNEKTIENVIENTSIIKETTSIDNTEEKTNKSFNPVEGDKVKLKYKKERIFTVVKDEGNILKVKDDTSTSYNMAKSDFEPVAD